jgi:membrane protein implicated in regulation of membrane protease activity
MSPTKRWLLAAVISVVVEILPPPTHFAFLAVAFGALAAAIVSVYSTSIWLPWMTFVVVSIALMPIFIPLARFLFTPRQGASDGDDRPR